MAASQIGHRTLFIGSDRPKLREFPEQPPSPIHFAFFPPPLPPDLPSDLLSEAGAGVDSFFASFLVSVFFVSSLAVSPFSAFSDFSDLPSPLVSPARR